MNDHDRHARRRTGGAGPAGRPGDSGGRPGDGDTTPRGTGTRRGEPGSRSAKPGGRGEPGNRSAEPARPADSGGRARQQRTRPRREDPGYPRAADSGPRPRRRGQAAGDGAASPIQQRPDRGAARGQHAAAPQIPADVTADQLDASVRAELRTLPRDLADLVARHLAAAGQAGDPEAAVQHAAAARRLAARVGVVREACGVAAYLAGHWAEALAELRAARRLTGRAGYLAMMADCERALGRPDRALALVTGPEATAADRAEQIELRIVESGIRRDMGAAAAAVVVLQVPELTGARLRPWSARLFYAYADALLDAGRADEARDWFARAAAADTTGETDAAERFDQLDDVAIEDLAEGAGDDPPAAASGDRVG